MPGTVIEWIEKKSRKTRNADLVLARRRLWLVQALRAKRKER